VNARALGFTLRDSVALGERSGPGARIALGTAAGAEILAPACLVLTPEEARPATAGRCVFSFGNQAAPPEIESLAPVLDAIIARSPGGFMLACLAAPEWGRFVYQGYLFQNGHPVAHLRDEFARHLSGRAVIIPHSVAVGGGIALDRHIAACREQGAALALLDAVDAAQCAALAQVLAAQPLVGGAAWVAGPQSHAAEPPAPVGRTVCLSGALDRQTLFQLGAARGTVPYLQIDPATPDTTAALAWAAAQGEACLIATSASPGRHGPITPAAAEHLAEIAAGLAAQGVTRFIIAGNDTAAIILRRLGVTALTVGAEVEALRWMNGGDYNFLLKPGGFGGQFLFLGGIGPQIRLNATAE